MKVIFIRHGESTGNAGVPTNDLSSLQLTERGTSQAHEIAYGWSETPDFIAISPYLRTRLTAAPTISRFSKATVETLPMEEFTYLEPARWNGTSRASRLPHIEAFWSSADPTHRDGAGAESFDMLLSRVHGTFQRLNALPQGTLVYAFSHGQFMQATRLRLIFPAWTSKELMQHFWAYDKENPIPNCGSFAAVRSPRQLWAIHTP